MLELAVSGTPYELGFKHGSKAKQQVLGSLAFYKGAFLKSAKLAWPAVQELAGGYEATIASKWPEYLQEMQGIADGSGRPLVDILALNVRTEITFGQFSDGCTALGWLTNDVSWLAQNWDWNNDQKENLILLTVKQPPKPTITMVTEAGIIGKIGMNSSGVGVCLNAIRAKGMDPQRIPCHLGLRLALDSTSRNEAIARLEKYGVASSCHMLIGDASGTTGVEWSAEDVQKIEMNEQGQVLHTNHYVKQHPEGVVDTWASFISDSQFRLKRLGEIVEGIQGETTKTESTETTQPTKKGSTSNGANASSSGNGIKGSINGTNGTNGTPRSGGPSPSDSPSLHAMQSIFKDSTNYPAAICRGPEDKVATTLFNIVMDLKAREAWVSVGMPTAPDREFRVGFGGEGS